MFKIANWYHLRFSFERDGKHYSKDSDSDNFAVDGCEHEVIEDDDFTHDMPILIMWLIDVGAVTAEG